VYADDGYSGLNFDRPDIRRRETARGPFGGDTERVREQGQLYAECGETGRRAGRVFECGHLNGEHTQSID